VSVLVVAPHPDDEVLGCGGTIAALSAQGKSVCVVVVSRGAPDLFPEAVVEATRAELRAAHGVLGIQSCEFLDFPAPRLDRVPQHEISDALRRVVVDLRPELVFLPHPGDIHHDHRIAFNASMVATRPLPGESPRRILTYETLSETGWSGPYPDKAFIPNVFVDIGAYLETKIEAMASYRSQLLRSPHPRSLEGIRALSAMRGHTVGLAHAEAFFSVREIVSSVDAL
jgi:LmbE family N-acetylglucosaminyl deacetylase